MTTTLHDPDRPDISLHVETITPEYAAYLLEEASGFVNRNVRQDKVARYATDMRLNRWRLTGEAIKLSPDGTLIDGQHRLLACVKAGVQFTTVVVYNVGEDAVPVFDTGVARRPSDVLKMRGYSNYASLAAVAARILWYRERGLISVPKGVYARNAEDIVKVVETTPQIHEAVRVGQLTAARSFGATTTTLGTAYCALYEFDEGMTDTFFDQLYSGVNLEDGHPILALRSALFNLKGRSRRQTPDQNLPSAYIVKAWNAYVTGAPIRSMRWSPFGQNPESFPKILDPRRLG